MRLFPRTARRRLVAAAAACSLAVGGLAVPLAFAGEKDLNREQKHAQSEVKHAQQDLDESSSQVRESQAALDQAQAALDAARGDLQAASAKLAAAEVRDQETQDRLDAAEQRLATAEQDVAAGQTAVTDQHEQVTDTITDIYEQGDPELLAFAALLNSQTTADLARQSEARDAIVGRQTRAYDDLHAAEVLLQVREDQVQEARDAVEVEREAAAAHLVTMERLHRETRAARDRVVSTVKDRRDARASAAEAQQRDLRDLRIAQAARAADQAAAPGCRAPCAHGATTARPTVS